jgi:hypothetical protein
MSSHFERVKEFVAESGYAISKELVAEQMIVVDDEASGINNLIIDCEDSIVVLEQFIFDLQDAVDASVLRRLLQLNRELVHGALVLDESGKKVIFRDTLQLENLDLNELEASIKSISLMLGEHADELIAIAKRS